MMNLKDVAIELLSSNDARSRTIASEYLYRSGSKISAHEFEIIIEAVELDRSLTENYVTALRHHENPSEAIPVLIDIMTTDEDGVIAQKAGHSLRHIINVSGVTLDVLPYGAVTRGILLEHVAGGRVTRPIECFLIDMLASSADWLEKVNILKAMDRTKIKPSREVERAIMNVLEELDELTFHRALVSARRKKMSVQLTGLLSHPDLSDGQKADIINALMVIGNF